MIGKIIGTSLAGILQFLYGCNRTFAYVCCFVFFWCYVGPTARVSPELMEQAQHELSGTAQMYIKSCGTYQCSILIGFVVYFIGGYFLYSSFMLLQLVPLLIIKPIHNNFYYPSLCL
jgi:ABC-2 type transport system permease protein